MRDRRFNIFKGEYYFQRRPFFLLADGTKVNLKLLGKLSEEINSLWRIRGIPQLN